MDINSSSWSTIQAKFREGEAVNIQGTSGPLDFNPLTEELESTVELWTLGGEYDCFAALRECDEQINCSEVALDSNCMPQSGVGQLSGPFVFSIMSPPTWICEGTVSLMIEEGVVSGSYTCSDGQSSFTDSITGNVELDNVVGTFEIDVWNDEDIQIDWAGEYINGNISVSTSDTFPFEGNQYEYTFSMNAE